EEASVAEEELEGYYSLHAPPGSPPLEAIRDHVRKAIVVARHQSDAPGEVRSRAIAEVIDDLGNMAVFDFVPLGAPDRSPYPPAWLDARRGLAKMRSLLARVRGVLAGEAREPEASPRSTRLPIAAHAEVWRAVASDLEEAIRVLRPAAAVSGRFCITMVPW